MLKKSISSFIIASALLIVPTIANADTQTDATISPSYETLVGSPSRYVFPKGKSIKLYPSVRIAIPLTSDQYEMDSIPTKVMFKGDNDHTYHLKLSQQGKDYVDKKLSNLPGTYKPVSQSASTLALFTYAEKDGKASSIQGFKAGADPTSSGDMPKLSQAMYVVTLTADSKTIDSSKDFKQLSVDTSADRKSIQKNLGTLSKEQTTFIALGSTSLTAPNADVNTNTNVATAQRQSKTKIVNLDAYKMAEAADKQEKQQIKKEKHAKNVRYALIATTIVVIASIIGGLTYYLKKQK